MLISSVISLYLLCKVSASLITTLDTSSEVIAFNIDMQMCQVYFIRRDLMQGNALFLLLDRLSFLLLEQ